MAELEPLRCPFCGSFCTNFTMTDDYKWGAVQCMECGATGPEVRTDGDRGEGAAWHNDAVKEWNRQRTRPLLERLAELEHDQWCEWAKAVQGEVSPERRERWKPYMTAYCNLPEDVKELDRVWARKVLAEVMLWLGEGRLSDLDSTD